MKNIMRILFTLSIALFAISVVAQYNFEILTSIATKGKKQGLYDVVEGKWISPLSNQFVFELGNDFYGTYDRKTGTVKGIFHNKDFTVQTEDLDKLYISEKNDWYDFPIYQMEEWLVTNEGEALGKVQYPQAIKPNANVGVIPISNGILVGRSVGKNMFDLTLHETKKGAVILDFKNVQWRLDDNKLYLANFKLKDKDGAAENTAMKIDIYDIQDKNLTLVQSIKRDSSEKYDQLLNWIEDSYSTNNPNPSKSPDAIKEQFYAFYETDFKKDSSEKYSLIHDIGEFVIFANETGAWITSTQQKWLEIGNTLEYSENNYEYSEIKGVELQGDNLIIRKSYGKELMARLDEFGEPMYDDFGNPLYQHIAGENLSGVWNIRSKSWIIEPVFLYANIINDVIVANEIIYESDENSEFFLNEEYHYKTFDLTGEMLKTFNQDELPALYKSVYKADSLTAYQYGYTSYHRNGLSNLVNLNNEPILGKPQVFASFSDSLIHGTFNQRFTSAICNDNGDFFMLINVSEIGPFKVKIDYPFFGRERLNSDTWESNWIKSSSFPKESITHGVENYGKYSIIRNVTETEIVELVAYDEYGYELYDQYGYPVYDEEITKGHYNTGLWGNENNDWLLQPIYENIIITKNGFTAVLRKDYYTKMLDDFNSNAIRLDSSSVQYVSYDRSLNKVKQFSHLDNPYENSSYHEFLVNIDDIEKIVQKPEAPISSNFTIGSYYWARHKSGKYSMCQSFEGCSSIDIAIKNVDWLHEASGLLFSIDNDSLNVWSKQSNGKKLSYRLSDTFEILYTDQFIQVDINNVKKCYGMLGTEIGDEINTGKDYGTIYAKISCKDNEIMISNNNRIFIETTDNWDSYISANLKENREIIWRKEENLWQYKIDGAEVLPLSDFGYAANYNYNDEYFSTNTIDAASLYDINLNKIKFPKVMKITSGEKVLDGYIISYETYDNEYLIALLDENGEILVDGYTGFSVQEDKILFTSYSAEGFPSYDENGNEIELLFSFKKN